MGHEESGKTKWRKVPTFWVVKRLSQGGCLNKWNEGHQKLSKFQVWFGTAERCLQCHGTLFGW